MNQMIVWKAILIQGKLILNIVMIIFYIVTIQVVNLLAIWQFFSSIQLQYPGFYSVLKLLHWQQLN